ncbi:unnamed protein product [Acanthocheilonema viteae]|uniref:NUP210 C-terminal Ig-like domain-containing protein n=1 Tax=Acanthocheilonema viteae TaxID=6277 RepID=A0A498SL46_ACAVI|nr:unnamed protein product [Acanthocheilonema viteae]
MLHFVEVWDWKNPDLNVFLRLSVGDVIRPSVHSVALSEIVCFNSPLSVSGWKELDGKRHFQFIDEKNGIALAMDTDCAPALLETLILDAPFDCTASFMEKVNVLATSLFVARSAFLPKLGKYGCILMEQTFEGPVSLVDYQNLDLNVSAIWNRAGKVEVASVIVTFYSRFEIVQREIRLNNVNALEADLVIQSSTSAASKISVEADDGGVLRLKKIKSASRTEIRYRVQV